MRCARKGTSTCWFFIPSGKRDGCSLNCRFMDRVMLGESCLVAIYNYVYTCDSGSLSVIRTTPFYLPAGRSTLKCLKSGVLARTNENFTGMVTDAPSRLDIRNTFHLQVATRTLQLKTLSPEPSLHGLSWRRHLAPALFP